MGMGISHRIWIGTEWNIGMESAHVKLTITGPRLARGGKSDLDLLMSITRRRTVYFTLLRLLVWWLTQYVYVCVRAYVCVVPSAWSAVWNWQLRDPAPPGEERSDFDLLMSITRCRTVYFTLLRSLVGWLTQHMCVFQISTNVLRWTVPTVVSTLKEVSTANTAILSSTTANVEVHSLSPTHIVFRILS